ncbi:MAG: SRPBCC domain-containing protein [Polyangiaceae bacterium]
MSKLTLKTEGDTHVVVTRWFNAPPEAVYRAHMDPELIRQWCLGPDGWTMSVCINEAKQGGKIRYEWVNGSGKGFFLTGEILEVEPPHRVVHVERMHMPNPTPDNHVVTTFVPDSGGTLLTMRMSLPDTATRKAMLATGMEHGMEASYVRLERLSGWGAAA